MIKKFEEIPVWIVAHGLVIEIYRLTKKFPKSETYGLISQIRRSSASIAANIVEGFYRNTTKELIQFLYNSRGSTGETIYHLILARDLGYISKEKYTLLSDQCNNIAKQLNGWIRSLRLRILK